MQTSGARAPGTTDAKKNAKTWGEFLVAVYVKNDIDVQEHINDSDDDGGVAFEGNSPSGSGSTMMYHGFDELVIPVELFDKIKLVRNADDVAMTSDPAHGVVAYEDGVSRHSKKKSKK